MPLESYAQARPWAKAIGEAVASRRMPPWFAVRGDFANDPGLTGAERSTILEWARSSAIEGPKPASVPPAPVREWNVEPGLVLEMPQAFAVGAKSEVPYQTFVLRAGLGEDRWVSAVEIRPGDRRIVHHAVLYVRPEGAEWTSEAPLRKADILAVYTPGSRAASFPPGTAKLLPKGADLLLQIHYTAIGMDARDRTRVALAFRGAPPPKRLLTLQMGVDDLRIPPGERNYKATVAGTFPADAEIVSLLPHMHLRGSAFSYELFEPGGRAETLLEVRPYDFYWQMAYWLRKPRLVRKGAVLRLTGWFDNSANNPRNPDPSAEVRWGEQSWDEMMIGFFDVAVDAGVDKNAFFRMR